MLLLKKLSLFSFEGALEFKQSLLCLNSTKLLASRELRSLQTSEVTNVSYLLPIFMLRRLKRTQFADRQTTGRMRSIRNAPLAQLVEQLTLNQWVPGSNP